MNPKFIVVAIALLLVVGTAVIVFDKDKDDSEFDRTGEWYAMYDEIGRFDSTGGTITSEYYEFSDKAHLFEIDDIQKNTFSGSISGVPIIGGLMGDMICFEVVSESKGYYCHVEGTFETIGTLALQLIFHEDETFSDVTGGMYIFYAHESAKNEPSMPAFLVLGDYEYTNGVGKSYYIDDNDELKSKDYTPGFEVVKSDAYITIIKSEQMGKEFYSICLFEGFDDTGKSSFLIGGDIPADDGNIVFFGGMYIADEKLTMHLNGHLTGSAPDIVYATSQFDTDCDFGKLSPRADISGKWNGTVCDYDGKDVNKSCKDIIKNITVSDSAFCSVETITEDGAVSEFSWIGSVVGNGIFLIAEHDGRYFPLFGYVDGDEMYLCGFMITEGKYIGLNLELTRSK